MKILHIGDVCGEPGRKTVRKVLPEIKKEYGVDLITANCENVAHGRGVTTKTAQELLDAGVDFLTSGDHVFRIEHFFDDLDNRDFPIIRPANYPADVVGRGYDLIDLGEKGNVLIINLEGLTSHHENLITCPFRKLDEILENTRPLNPTATIVDFHGEFTADKKAFGFYADGRVTAVLGTHTHVATADHRVLKDGTAYVTDVGMTGPQDAVLWVKKEVGIRFQMYPYSTRFEMEEDGPMEFNSVLVEVGANGKAKSIQRIDRIVNL